MIRKSYRKHTRPEKKILARRMRNEPTQAESIMWEVLKGGTLGVKFRRQAIIYGWIVDFYSPKAELVIEIDGEYHKKQIREDERRSKKIRTIGVDVMRFTNAEIINNTEKVIAKIVEYIEFKKANGYDGILISDKFK